MIFFLYLILCIISPFLADASIRMNTTTADAVMDVYLDNVPHQLQNGMYTRIHIRQFIRRLDQLGIYFILTHTPTDWHLQGYKCNENKNLESPVCQLWVTL